MATSEKRVTKISNSIKIDSTVTADSNLETFTCLWLDKYVNSTEDNRKTLQELRQVINHLRTFDDANECDQYIRQITKEKVILIVSGSFGRQVLPRLHNLPQFSACYVFCQDKPGNEKWAGEYHKILGVFVKRAELVEQISKDQISRGKTDSCPSISVLNHSAQSIESRNAIFLWFQLFIEVLLRMHHNADERKELIDICKSNYKNNYEQMEIIEDFETNYDAQNTIWWYTRESCFYRIINKALRVQDFDMLFSLRFFITDIADMINKGYETFVRSDKREIISVYRGQVVANDELELMKRNIKEYLSMNSFLSTSRKRSTALFFARTAAENNRDLQPIIFEIQMNPRLKTKAFADVTQLSYFKGEDEILIMLGALFRIEEVTYDQDDKIWVARLSLASDDDFDLNEIFSHIKAKIGQNTSLDSLGKLLIRMGENEKALKCYERMLNESLLAVGDARLGLGWANLRCNNWDESREHLEEALEIRQHLLGENHPSVGETYSFLGELHIENEDYKEALVDLKKAIKIQEKTLPPDSLGLAATYDSIANTYTVMEKYDLAIEYYKKVLKIREKKLPASHPQIAAIYKNFGWMYEHRKSYSEALKYYQKSLEISRKTLPPTHYQIVETENAIRQSMDKIKVI